MELSVALPIKRWTLAMAVRNGYRDFYDAFSSGTDFKRSLEQLPGRSSRLMVYFEGS